VEYRSNWPYAPLPLKPSSDHGLYTGTRNDLSYCNTAEVTRPEAARIAVELSEAVRYAGL
jgi:hypothetical protein